MNPQFSYLTECGPSLKLISNSRPSRQLMDALSGQLCWGFGTKENIFYLAFFLSENKSSAGLTKARGFYQTSRPA